MHVSNQHVCPKPKMPRQQHLQLLELRALLRNLRHCQACLLLMNTAKHKMKTDTHISGSALAWAQKCSSCPVHARYAPASLAMESAGASSCLL